MANRVVGSMPTSGKKQAGGVCHDHDAVLASNVKAVAAECQADYQENTAFRHGQGQPPGEGPNKAKVKQFGAGMD